MAVKKIFLKIFCFSPHFVHDILSKQSLNLIVTKFFSSNKKRKVKMSRKPEEFILALDTPYEQLSVREAFEHLTENERKYLHFYTKVNIIFVTKSAL